MAWNEQGISFFAENKEVERRMLLINTEKLKYSIITEIRRGNKIFPDESNEGLILDPEKTGNSYLYTEVVKSMEGNLILRKLMFGKLKVPFRDLTTKGFEYFRSHNEWANEYPGWFSEKLKDWLNEP